MRSIEDIILEKKYEELSPEELVLVSELAENEEEFNQMKQLFDNMNFGMGEVEAFEASTETKNSLDAIFSAKHPVIANDWKKEEEAIADTKIVAFYNRNWVRVAAILLIFLGISVVYIQNSEEITSKTKSHQVAKAEAPLESSSTSSIKETKPADQKTVHPIVQDEKEKQLLAVAIPQKSNAWMKSDDNKNMETRPGTIDDEPITKQQALNAGTSVINSYSGSAATYAYSTSVGLNSDLYPNGKSDKDRERRSSVTTDVPAADMLDWIQAAY